MCVVPIVILDVNLSHDFLLQKTDISKDIL